jgi:hypothetical protein
MSSLQQNWRKGQNKFCLEAGKGGRKRREQEQGVEIAQCMHI